MDNEINSNGSFVYLNSTTGLVYNNTESALSALTILILTICTAGILANSLIIIVVLFGSLRKYVIMNLFLALATVENLYLLITIEKQRGIFGKIFIKPSLLHCRVIEVILYAISIISAWITVLIALERYIAICYPFKVHVFCTKRIAYVTILMISGLGLVNSTPFSYTCSVYSVSGMPVCHSKGENPKTDFIVILNVYIFYSIIPFLVITTLNILIIKRIRSQRAFRIRSQGHTSTLATRDTSLVSMMTAICIVFVITCFPMSVLMIYSYSHRYFYGKSFLFEDWLSRFLFLLEVINHCVNLFLYCVTGSVFRTSLLQMFKCKKKQCFKRQSAPMMTISQNIA